jgi:hypothetical protein
VTTEAVETTQVTTGGDTTVSLDQPHSLWGSWNLESPRAFEKPPKLETYEGTTYPDEDVEHIDTILDYYKAQGTIKCKLFMLTLKGAAMTWFKGIEDNSIDSSYENQF